MMKNINALTVFKNLTVKVFKDMFSIPNPKVRSILMEWLIDNGWSVVDAIQTIEVVDLDLLLQIKKKAGFLHVLPGLRGTQVTGCVHPKFIDGVEAIGMSLNLSSYDLQRAYQGHRMASLIFNSLIIHELTHLDQIHRGDMIIDARDCGTIQSITWKGKVYKDEEMHLFGTGCSISEYESTPWEVEAYAKQQEYLNSYGLEFK